MSLVRSRLEPLENALSEGLACLDLRVDLPQRGRIDFSRALGERRAEDAAVDEGGDLREDPVLLAHVRGLEDRAGEHELPRDGDALPLERHDIERFRGSVRQASLCYAVLYESRTYAPFCLTDARPERNFV